MATPHRRPGRPAGATRPPEVRREELLSAAERAIRHHGPGVSMEQIAAEAGVSKATVYDNLRSKRTLTEGLLDRYGARLVAAIDRAISVPLRPRQVLRGGISVFVAQIEDESQLYRFVLAEGGDRTLLDEAAAPVAALFAAVLDPDGDEGDGAAQVHARAVLGAVFAATEWWVETRPVPRSALVDQLDALLWPGLAAAGLDRSAAPLDPATMRRAIGV